jgi:chorismate synthase
MKRGGAPIRWGGSFEVLARGLPPGLGSHAHWDRRLDARLGAALLSIQAVKGVSIGDGIDVAVAGGREAHDAIGYDAAARRFTASRTVPVESRAA